MRMLRTLVLVVLVVLALCGGWSNGSSSAGASGDASAAEELSGASPKRDRALVAACKDREPFIELWELAEDPPDDPAKVEARLDALTADIEERAGAPGTAREDPIGADYAQLARFLPTYVLAWEISDFDPDELAASGLADVVADDARFVVAQDWVKLTKQVCDDGIVGRCRGDGLTSAQCVCVEETYAAGVIEYGRPLDAAGILDLGGVRDDCPKWVGDDWCKSTGAVDELSDFVLGDFGDPEELTKELRTGDLTSQKKPITAARDAWDDFVAGSPRPVQSVTDDIDSFLDDWEDVWADAGYAYARILTEDDLTERYQALLAENLRFDSSISLLLAVTEVLCDDTRTGFLDSCIAEGGTLNSCSCVYASVGDGVFSGGLPRQPDGSLDAAELSAVCRT